VIKLPGDFTTEREANKEKLRNGRDQQEEKTSSLILLPQILLQIDVPLLYRGHPSTVLGDDLFEIMSNNMQGVFGQNSVAVHIKQEGEDSLKVLQNALQYKSFCSYLLSSLSKNSRTVLTILAGTTLYSQGSINRTY
jgi:hypothetical protein